jgi:hypothetical protein
MKWMFRRRRRQMGGRFDVQKGGGDDTAGICGDIALEPWKAGRAFVSLTHLVSVALDSLDTNDYKHDSFDNGTGFPRGDLLVPVGAALFTAERSHICIYV